MTKRDIICVLNSYKVDIVNALQETANSKDKFLTNAEFTTTLAHYGGQIDMLNELIDYLKNSPSDES